MADIKITTDAAKPSKGTLSDRNIPTREYFTDEPGPEWTQTDLSSQRYEFECDAEGDPGTTVTVAVYDTTNNNAVLGSASGKVGEGGAVQVKVFFSVVQDIAPGIVGSSHRPTGRISVSRTTRNLVWLLSGYRP